MIFSKPISIVKNNLSLWFIYFVILFPINASAQIIQSYDVVIYGGTSAGVSAAIQSSRMGKKVILIEPTHRIGGLTTGGLGKNLKGAYLYAYRNKCLGEIYLHMPKLIICFKKATL